MTDADAPQSVEPTTRTLEPPTPRKPSRVSPDRRSISGLRMAVLTVLVGLMLWSALSSLPSGGGSRGINVAAQAAALCAVLAMFGLRSVPVRWIVRGLALVSGVLLARFGELGIYDGLSGSWRVLLWLGSLAGALVLAPSSRTVPGVDVGSIVPADQTPAPEPESGGRGRGGGRRGGESAAGDGGSGRRFRTRGGVPIALIVAAVALIGASSLLIGPRVANLFPAGPRAGDVLDNLDNRTDNALVARDNLDMTGRPRLGDTVVMTVRSPIVAFWRTETFDQWNGSSWTRTGGRSGRLVEGGRVVPSPEDLAAIDGEPSTQEFRIEARYATALPAAASPVEVDTSDEIAQRADGTLWSPGAPLGQGATYRVESRQIPVDATSLQQGGDASTAAEDGDSTATDVLDQYAQPPDTTARVTELAQQVTEGSTDDYDRIRALEAWMGAHTTYSIDAPLAPRGVDVVDDFLFVSKEGWCEQIASSLVVMARSVGVPARLATGFAPGEWDPVGGRFIVRERDAHAWAEVWFPDAGWVSFDPTANVPLAGADEATAGANARDWRELVGALLLVIGVVALAAGPVTRLVRRVGDRLRATRRHRRVVRTRWDAAAEARLEQLGAAAGRPRAPAETVTSYAVAVASVLEDDRVQRVGVIVDRTRYGPAPAAPSSEPGASPASGQPGADEERAFVDEVLASH